MCCRTSASPTAQGRTQGSTFTLSCAYPSSLPLGTSSPSWSCTGTGARSPLTSVTRRSVWSGAEVDLCWFSQRCRCDCCCDSGQNSCRASNFLHISCISLEWLLNIKRGPAATSFKEAPVSKWWMGPPCRIKCCINLLSPSSVKLVGLLNRSSACVHIYNFAAFKSLVCHAPFVLANHHQEDVSPPPWCFIYQVLCYKEQGCTC